MNLKAFVFILAIIVLASSLCAGQAAVLIGLQRGAYDEGEKWHPPGYRTLLISFRDGKAQLVADIPALIVPRKDGFWRLGVLHDGSENNYLETLYAVPALSTPPTYSQIPEDESIALEHERTHCSSYEKSTITFVNPEVVSIENNDYSDCGVHPGGGLFYTTYKIDDLHTRIKINALLGPAALIAQKKSVPKPGPEECAPTTPDASNWGIYRLGAKWVVSSSYTEPQICNGDHEYKVKLTPPASLIGLTYHQTQLALLAAPVKTNGLGHPDAVLTPAGDFLIYLDSLEIFSVNAHGLSSAPVLSIENHGAPVMIQWSFGKYVARWESALKEITAKLPKEPEAPQPKP